MNDEDNVREACLPKAVALKFRCYPFHAGVKVFKVSNCQCAICGNSPAKYKVSIIVSSLRKEEALKL